MIRLLIIGHRGVGKSTLLHNLSKHYSQMGITFFSLDEYLQEQTGLTIKEIFCEQGEEEFRRIETKYLNELAEEYSQKSLVIDVGAGFRGEKPKGFKALWIKRKIDSSQSLFLNRPPLDGSMTISKERFLWREKRYKELADFEIECREGMSVFASGEKRLFSALLLDEAQPLLPRWTWTLPVGKDSEADILKKLGIGQLELRDDWTSREKMKTWEREPNSLVSLRENQKKYEPAEGLWDWPLEWGFNAAAPILSLHQRKSDFSETLAGLPETDQILKLAVPVHNFQELKEGHQWQSQDPQARCFLPCSDTGRWSWYRLLMAHKMPLNFIRLAVGSAFDQPSLLEVLNFNPDWKAFAAVLGSPVVHSFTPTYHQDFFNEKGANVLAIDVSETEFSVALPFLQELGLKWAAVTSPLKKKAAEVTNSSCESVNTLFYDGKAWLSGNTDDTGMVALADRVPQGPVAVWGGGGTTDAIRKIFPKAPFYSSRSGHLKQGEPALSPEILIWAVGKNHFRQQGVFPPSKWPIKVVLDLNYSQDSPGLQCAHLYGCQYQSGLVMFAAQARKQQEFWNECEL